MQELIQFVYDYRTLAGRKNLLKLRLSAAETLRLQALERLLLEERSEGSRRRFARVEVASAGTLKLGNHHAPITIEDLGAGGVRVTGVQLLSGGDLTVLTVRCARTGTEYRLPAQVAWRDGQRAGLCFVGIPVAKRHVTTPPTAQAA